ncbi:MAG: DsrE family protein [Candidatus Thorarchaeota archaeon]
MESVLICCDKSPFGTNVTAEALRLASGLLGLGPTISCQVVFDEDSIYFLMKNSSTKGLGVDSLDEPRELIDLVDATIYVVKEAMETRGLSRSDLVDDIEIELITIEQLAHMITQHSATIHM